MKKRILTGLLVGMMLIGTACGNSGGTSSATSQPPAATAASAQASDASAKEGPSAAANGEVVELRMLSLPANSSGIAEGWWGDEVEKAVGVRLNLLPSGDQGEQKLQALMASGDLPDLVVFKDYKQVENAVDGDMLLAYDDYQDLLPNLYANASVSLRYFADNVSMGKGKAYGVGAKIKTDIETVGDMGPYLRYDVYTKVGAPEMRNYADLLSTLRLMQDAEPVNADGQKVYALSFFKDWDRSYMTLGMFAAPIMGAKIPDEGCLAEIHYGAGTDEVVSILSDNSLYLQFVRFCFDANQMGLMDPDSITQRFDDSVQKTKDGRVLFSMDGWGASDFSTLERQNNGIGFRPVPIVGVKRLVSGLQPVGVPWTMSVSKSTKLVEKAMAFVDWNFSYEGARVTINGPKGVTWDVDASGKPYATEFYYEYQKTPDAEFASGKNYAKGGSPINCVGFNNAVIDPANGSALARVCWPKPSYAPADSELLKQWQSDYDAIDFRDYVTKDASRYQLESTGTYPSLTDEMEQISARVGDIVKTASWKMVFAKNEAEFSSLKEKMIADAAEVGIQKFVDWYSGEYANSVAEAQKYSK